MNIGDLIDHHRDEILGSWANSSGQAVSARSLTTTELSSFMPDFLSLLGRQAGNTATLNKAQLALIHQHLANRLRQGFDLNEILTEFAILGRSLSVVLEGATEVERPAVVDVARVFAELHQTSQEVSKVFTEHLLEDEQTMKRYARLLDTLAEDPHALPGGSGPIGGRLDEVLALIAESTSARAVALLILDPSGERGTTTAAIGEGSAELELYVRSLEATTFSGKAGVADSAGGSPKLPAALRQGGIGGLLRVAHQGRSQLSYVIYVAIAAARPFTPSELRRVEGLCRELTIHLDNAQLHATLRAKVDELRIEREHREHMMSMLVRAVRGPLAAARENATRLLEEPAGLSVAAVEVTEALGRLELVVDQLLATTPAVRSDVAR